MTRSGTRAGYVRRSDRLGDRRADSWPGSRPQVFASAIRRIRLQDAAAAAGHLVGQEPRDIVRRWRQTAPETVLWTRELVNIPVSAFVADDGKHVVTFDTWAKLGYEHALVIYGEQGAVVVDYDLEALLSADEIATSVVHTVSARRWLQGATIAFDNVRTTTS